ncbi:unnamed protein product [Acanthoscelides obtectus]|uniref:LysM domain-containing protein n=1 Tax=Acanthoscelides obtectus TaxID=200917 RepID=A0A9P0K3Z6_ACAOB|nr:unnamed protein product [Acanthoscelides obtectus]CAK1667387.1 LysM and putative peptidoglycan-binding domain-containing protein 3 [Acanthoscelides obtectus]
MIKQRQKNRVYDVSHSRLQDNLRGKDNASDSGGEETELFVRNKSPKKDIPTVEKLVQDGDTLQSLAIRYHCTIEELKRLNNIHKENEIFARTTIRVPHRPFAMALAGVHSSGTTSPIKDLPSSSKIVDITSLNSRLKDSGFKIKLQRSRLRNIVGGTDNLHSDTHLCGSIDTPILCSGTPS